MLLRLELSGDTPVYQQIRNQVVAAIASGELLPGERLPTIRALAEECGINMMTVSKAYQLLKAEGYITTGRRDGAVVRLPAGAPGPPTPGGPRLRPWGVRMGGKGGGEVLELCGKLYDGEVPGK